MNKIGVSTLLACLATAAIAQQPGQQSPFQPPAAVTHASTAANVDNATFLNLTGVTITDEAGQPLGPIQHILLSPAGCVDLAVLSLGQKLVPLPWRLVTTGSPARAETAAGGQITLAAKVERGKLQQAPSFTVNQLTQLSQQQTIQQVYNFYGVQQPANTEWQTKIDAQQGAQIGVGGTSSQTNILGGSLTNRAGVGFTNQSTAGLTNQPGIIPSPTGPTNTIPGRPPSETNRPGIIPPASRPPAGQPPLNRPLTNQPRSGITPSQPIPGTGQTPGQP